MKSFRIFLGVALIVHGLAHASAGMWATDIGGRTIVTVLWEGATVGFIAAGAGLFGVGILQRWWRELVVTAALSSLTLLLLYSHPLFIAGMAADFVLTALALAPVAGGELTTLEPVRRWLRLTLFAFLLYVAAAIGLRPWHSSWERPDRSNRWYWWVIRRWDNHTTASIMRSQFALKRIQSGHG